MRIALVIAGVVAALLVPGTASAAPPANDNFDLATVIDPSALPFSDSVTIDEATLEGGEPNGPPSTCYYLGKSVWYRFTPSSNGTIRADVSASTIYDRTLYVYRQESSGLAGLTNIGCASPYYNGPSSLTFNVQSGETYYLQVGSYYTWTSGTASLSLQAIVPPANDDFANAETASSLPFGDDVDTTAASVEAGEPTLCTPPASEKTAWYAYTPSSSGSVSARVTSAPAPTGIAVYTGGALTNLSNLGCQYGFPLTIHVDAGTTYYFQVGTFGQYGGELHFVLEVPPPPVVSLYYYPGDPSVFDAVQFSDSGTYDPASAGITSEAWSFGDGGTASNPGCCPTHRYLADGTYHVTLTVTTTDGRTGSITRDVDVRTHDVSIAKLTVPQSASVGQSRPIVVGLSNRRYPETVRIDLYRSTANGFVQFASSTQSVPVKSGGKTSDFSFNYVFTSDDAAIGKVTFRAVATIVTARDALLADNDIVSLPTKVK